MFVTGREACLGTRKEDLIDIVEFGANPRAKPSALLSGSQTKGSGQWRMEIKWGEQKLRHATSARDQD